MKKLMIMAMVMGLGFAVKAAECGSIYWNAYYTDSSTHDVTSAQLYCLLGGVGTCIDTLYKEDHPYEFFDGEITANTKTDKITEAGTYSFYAKLFTDNGDVWTSNQKSITFTLAKYYEGDPGILESDYGGETVFSMDFTSGSWNDVPEPTSGLLMLLGMAGLCLRRKQRR